ncbi:FMRFamide-activated amiloride-sensitive sodium channel-like [Lingula anatina]|uniref:FMRFamide-activated amiloride-sensitive sodium channel-like n=1 Tax=Lingula anatina TaxID=7574 RepID=A0A1S3IRC9_LINAN|nr:FMRFamide-activated amiloride-sensitive sodium channel-like [Lingula anatina]|eukprot:XP_013400770.1 FMRFamide-activated amiloride-sensitive sodium channel-like [Lingula anatina]
MAFDEFKRYEDEESPSRLLLQFGEDTTAHGVGNVVRKKQLFQRLIWLGLVIGAICATTYQLSEVCIKFFNYPSEEMTRTTYGRTEMPSITLCNINPISPSKQGDAQQKQNTYIGVLTMLSYLENATKLNRSDAANSHVFRLLSATGLYEHDENAPDEVGTSFQDFVIGCTFDMQPCGINQFSKFVDAQYYNCYTFNGLNVNDSLVSMSTGPRNGLSLILYLESDSDTQIGSGIYDKLSNTGNSAGARVVIHPPKTFPSPTDMGFDVSPGFSTSVSVRAERKELKGLPYSNCSEDSLTAGTAFRYTSEHCMKICQQQFVIERCGCMAPNLPKVSDEIPDNITYCGYLYSDDYAASLDNVECEDSALREFVSDSRNSEKCECYSPCSEFSYRTALSQSFWPLDYYANSFLLTYVFNHPNYSHLLAYKNFQQLGYSDLGGAIRRNFLRLNVYFEDLSVQENVEIASYEFQDFFSDLGGTFGFWIGVSMLTLCELIELLVRVFYFGVSWCFVRKKKRSPVIHVSEAPTRYPSVSVIGLN